MAEMTQDQLLALVSSKQIAAGPRPMPTQVNRSGDTSREDDAAFATRLALGHVPR